MKHYLFTFLFAFLAVGAFAQVPPKPTDKAVVYDYAGMLTPEDKVGIELMGLKLSSKCASKLLFISVETKGNMKGVDFIRAIYSDWEIPDGVKGHCGIIVVCKKQIMASAGGGFLVKCDNVLTMKIKDSFQELLDKTTLPPFANVDDQNPLKGSAALRDSYMHFANAIIALHKEETTPKTQAVDQPTTAATAEAVSQSVNPSTQTPSSTTAESPEATNKPQPNDNVPQAQIPQTTAQSVKKNFNRITWILCCVFFGCIIVIYLKNKQGGRSHTSNNKKKNGSRDYDSNDYRDDNYNDDYSGDDSKRK